MKIQLKKQNRHEPESVNQTGIQAKSLTDIRPMDNALAAPQKPQTEDINHQQIQKKPGFNFAEIPISGNTDGSASRIQPKFNLSLQKKLTVGAAGDKYEQEADSVAEKVVKQINTPTTEKATSSKGVQRQEEEEVQAKADSSAIQREGEEEEVQAKSDSSNIQREGEEEEVQAKSDSSNIQREGEEEEEVQAKPDISAIQREGEEEEEIQAKPDISAIQREGEEEEEVQAKSDSSNIQREGEEEEEVQAKSDISAIQREGEEEEVQAKPQNKTLGGGAVSTDIETTIQSAKSGGSPLDAGLQQKMGKAMGADFSGVKVHTDSQADKLNRSLSSRAFATGPNLFFKRGEYNPGSRSGQELIAHELTHVVQQGGGQKTQKIQRVLEFDVNAELPKVSWRAKLSRWTSNWGWESTLSQIRRNVKRLQVEEARRFKLRELAVREKYDLETKEEYVRHLWTRQSYLRELSRLCNEWLKKHGKSDDERRQEKADDINILRGRVLTELAELEVELEQWKSAINVLKTLRKTYEEQSKDDNDEDEESEQPQTSGK